MLTTNSDVQLYDRWCKLQMCATRQEKLSFYLRRKPEPSRMQGQTLNMNLEVQQLPLELICCVITFLLHRKAPRKRCFQAFLYFSTTFVCGSITSSGIDYILWHDEILVVPRKAPRKYRNQKMFTQFD